MFYAILYLDGEILDESGYHILITDAINEAFEMLLHYGDCVIKIYDGYDRFKESKEVD